MLTDIMINSMSSLAQRRPVFHSEDDYKFELAQELAIQDNEFDVRLEKPKIIKMQKKNGIYINKRCPIDIILRKNNIEYPVELKYKTRESYYQIDDELFELTNHGACDTGRYNFRKDIYRVEQYLKNNPIADGGIVIFLTNESKYMDDVSEKDSLDRNYSIHQNAKISKIDKDWNYDALPCKKYRFYKREKLYKNTDNGTLHWTSESEYFYKLNLFRSYKIIWREYSNIENDIFSYILIEIERKRKK